jgi:peptidoglycan/LPS O-acetylase OafA/YrhL
MSVAAQPQRVSDRNTGASVSLDALRALAAILVVLDHIQHLLFVGYWTLPSFRIHPLLVRSVSSVFSTGPEAVVIFFVLSGYLVGGSVLRSFEQGRWSWRDYLTRRLVRLWLVLLPALALSAGWQLLRHLPPDRAWLAAQDVTWRTLFGNIALLQDIRVPNFGGNRVLWTLANEFWYYLLFPMMLLVVRGRTLAARIGYALLLVGVGYFVGHTVIALFPEWLMGVVLAWLPAGRTTARQRWVALIAYIVAIYVISMLLWPQGFVKMDEVAGLLTMGLIWLLLGWQQPVSAAHRWVRLARWLAGLSYSLYLVHYPMLQFFADHLAANGGWQPTNLHFAAALGLLLLATGYAAIVAAATERHNDRVRRWVEAHLPGRG